MVPSTRQIVKGLRDPVGATCYLAKPIYRNACVAVTSRFPLGTNILNQDWDVYIVLDTCRVDALREIAHEYGYLGSINQIVSVGGSSPEWMVHTFDRRWMKLLQNTAYLTANAWTERILDDRLAPDNRYSEMEILNRLRRFGDWDLVQSDDVGRIEKIWKYVSEDEKITQYHDPNGLMPGGAPPRYVTDRAISVAREFEYDRLILHYMQPHAPYVANSLHEERDLHHYEKEPFSYLRETGKRDEVWNAYIDELRFVLDDIELLLCNINAETVVISADHGEAFGEYSSYNHHTGSLHPKVRVVPWVVTSATDTGSYSPQVEPEEQRNISVDESLRALGYRI